ncbi:MAG: sulfurtransferase TusA family protein [Candidatus Riflebacteria bacterium]|nr:sulfurtransferase TusA family protein [Candidatus Riflebacteria bacterium]
MRENLFEHIQRRDCTRTSWERFNAREGFDLTGRPGCLWTGGAAPARLTSAPGSPAPPGLVGRAAPEGPAGWDDEWDAGDLGCGELTLGLRARMNKLFAGQVLRLVTGDPGALEDLSSWCRLTGHGLVSAAPPVFLIRRREV